MESSYLFRMLNGLSLPYALACLHEDRTEEAGAPPTGVFARRRKDSILDYAAAQRAIARLFAGQDFPVLPDSGGLLWRRDPLGKPFVEWSGQVAAWAQQKGLHHRDLHVSNSHDGGAHLVLAAYGEEIAGIGVDVVWMPRLSLPGKGENYLHRFARQFMSPEEYDAYIRNTNEEASHLAADPQFQAGAGASHPVNSSEGTVPSDLQTLRIRTAAHFSLMEAASKACGTGLKIGAGMGRDTSLPKQALGAVRLFPKVQLLCGPEAQARLAILGAAQYEAVFALDGDYLISCVVLYKRSNL